MTVALVFGAARGVGWGIAPALVEAPGRAVRALIVDPAQAHHGGRTVPVAELRVA